MTTITYSGGQIIPTAVDGYSARRASGNIVHEIIGRSIPDVTLRPAGPRSGSLRCVFGSRIAAQTAFNVFSTPQVLSLFNGDVPNVNMTFIVPPGDIELELDDQTRNAWVVTTPYVEVSP